MVKVYARLEKDTPNQINNAQQQQDVLQVESPKHHIR